jgi:hypothetical protein
MRLTAHKFGSLLEFGRVTIFIASKVPRSEKVEDNTKTNV